MHDVPHPALAANMARRLSPTWRIIQSPLCAVQDRDGFAYTLFEILTLPETSA